MISKIIMFLLHLEYKRVKNDIYYIKGTEENYPKYLLYTEKENVYKRMDRF
jgi:hypothetical protein